jgi:hypothetical protein
VQLSAQWNVMYNPSTMNYSILSPILILSNISNLLYPYAQLLLIITIHFDKKSVQYNSLVVLSMSVSQVGLVVGTLLL